jgi:3-dehydroquinate synthase
MQRIPVALGQPYDILIGPGLLAQLPALVSPLRPTRLLVVTNTTVNALYGADVCNSLAAIAPLAPCVLPDGESYKTVEQVQRVLDALLDCGADRKSVVIALGGGVIGDMAGFAAAIFMRGIRFVQVPTTLLAQVDSSVGGKTGVNHVRGKNLIGAFHQPALVVSDTETLRTLPPRELSAGLAEIVKHGLLADAEYFDAIVAQLPALRACEPTALTSAIAHSCAIKAGVVARDERESGERALLNLGHTFGHAIEALTGYGTWLHGEAVGCGLCLAADLSRRCGLIDASDVQRVEVAVAAAGLPTRIPGLSLRDALAAMAGDKKAEAGELGFILLERIGRAVQRRVQPHLVEETLRAGGYV